MRVMKTYREETIYVLTIHYPERSVEVYTTSKTWLDKMVRQCAKKGIPTAYNVED